MRHVLVYLLFAAAAAQTASVRPTGKTISENFTGVGFHAEMFLDQTTPEFFDYVIAKRWREINPAFARVFHHWRRGAAAGRDQASLDALLKQFLFLKSTGTEVYLTTAGPRDAQPGAEREAYARAVVDELEYLHQHGATNVTTYCMSNELSMRTWGSMNKDLPTFKDYHRLIYAEIARRKLPIKLLSTDASPISNWPSIEWAAANMDDVTGVYGGHHYANEHDPDNLDFYEFFRAKCAWGAQLARGKGKEFILGEFGPAQFLQHRYGLRWDANRWFDSPQEALGGLQLAEAALAAMNGGVRAMGYWTFMDYPEGDERKSVNHWGLFQWMKNGGAIRPTYYAYGLLTKFFRGPGRVLELAGSDPLLRAGMLRRSDSGAVSVAIVNRADAARSVAITIPAGAAFRKYEYLVAAPPRTEDGDLQAPSKTVRAAQGQLRDTLAPRSLTVYTTLYDNDAPAAATALKAERIRYERPGIQPSAAQQLTWQASASPDVIYYRILHDGKRVGSTATTGYTDVDMRNVRGGRYSVVAVDSSGNAAPAVEVEAGR
jgi:hypothetical protein